MCVVFFLLLSALSPIINQSQILEPEVNYESPPHVMHLFFSYSISVLGSVVIYLVYTLLTIDYTQTSIYSSDVNSAVFRLFWLLMLVPPLCN